MICEKEPQKEPLATIEPEGFALATVAETTLPAAVLGFSCNFCSLCPVAGKENVCRFFGETRYDSRVAFVPMSIIILKARLL